MDLEEVTRALTKATMAIRLVKQSTYFALFEELVGSKNDIIKPIFDKVKSRNNEIRNNPELGDSVLAEIQYITYSAYFVLLIKYSKDISAFFAAYSPDTIKEVCSEYREKYKPHIIRVKANFDILEEEYVSNNLFGNEENIYSSLDDMWNDVRTLKQYYKESLHYKVELEEQKKIEEIKNSKNEKEKSNNYLLQIGIAVIVFATTPFYQDIYNYMKKVFDGSSKSFPQKDTVKPAISKSTKVSKSDSLLKADQNEKKNQRGNSSIDSVERKPKKGSRQQKIRST